MVDWPPSAAHNAAQAVESAPARQAPPSPTYSPTGPDLLRADVACLIDAIERTGELPPREWERVLTSLETLPDQDVRRLLQAFAFALDRHGRLS